INIAGKARFRRKTSEIRCERSSGYLSVPPVGRRMRFPTKRTVLLIAAALVLSAFAATIVQQALAVGPGQSGNDGSPEPLPGRPSDRRVRNPPERVTRSRPPIPSPGKR
ncbi:hypothetical protein, partial [Halorubrum sp. SS7]|uniref:hypothetical protein n=1 Tax=Halorubrum sp. SS7 TaxID=2518119 RepID=UPI001A7E0C07